MAGAERRLIVRRVTEAGHRGHHGGAWKVAYADFVTAMMAFFLLLWLISSASDDTLKGLAEYFSEAGPTVGAPGGREGLLSGHALLPHEAALAVSGAPVAPPALQQGTAAAPSDLEGQGTAPGPADTPDEVSDELFEAERQRRERALFETARAAIMGSLEASAELSGFSDNLLIDQTQEGLRIQIMDGDDAPMFPIGSDQMYPHMRGLLEVVVRAIAPLPNRLSIRGHTDSLPFAPGVAYDNWRLSSARADVTRRVLAELGLDPARIADVTGKADSESLVPEAPDDPRNRRISLVLLHVAGPERAQASEQKRDLGGSGIGEIMRGLGSLPTGGRP